MEVYNEFWIIDINRKRNVIAITIVQFIIGDYKGNYLLYGRKGGKSLSIKKLYCDCNISPDDGGKPCICQMLLYSCHKMEKPIGK